MSKFITDGLVTLRMAEKGWIEGCDEEHAMKQVMAEFDCEISDEWRNPDFCIYEESTADGYTVWVAAADTTRINVNEDIYYYENQLADVVYEAIPDYSSIYCESLDTFVEEATIRHYEDLLILKEEEVIDQLVDEGYLHRVINPLNSLQWLEMMSQNDQLNKDMDKLYIGKLSVLTEEGYKWNKFALEVRQDLPRYEKVANMYGIKISRATAGEMIFETFGLSAKTE